MEWPAVCPIFAPQIYLSPQGCKPAADRNSEDGVCTDYTSEAGKRSLSMKRDRAMKELGALVLVDNPRLTTIELDSMTDP